MNAEVSAAPPSSSDRLAQLRKDSVVYGLGSVLARALGLLLLPVYTRIFTPADYGTIEMLTVVSSFLTQFMIMGMDSAQSMFFFSEKDGGKEAQARVVSAVLQWRLVWGAMVLLLATLASPLLNALLFDGGLGWEYFAVAFSGALLSQIMSQSTEVFRLLYRPWAYIGLTLTQSILAATLVLVLVLGFDQGVLGYLLGGMVASGGVAVLGWYRIRDYVVWSPLHREWWPRLLRFGAPLLPAGLSMYLMSTADRWFVQYYHGEEALGLFAVGAKFSLLTALGVEAFRRAWWPIAMDAMQEGDGPETFRMIARLYVGMVTACVVALTLVSPWLVRLTTAPAFHDSWPIVGVLAWQSLLYGFFMIGSAGIWKAEKTYLNLYLMGGSAILGIALNWFLVPPLGAMGAALSTVVTYLVWVAVSMTVSERLWRVRLPIAVLLAQVTVGSASVAWFLLVGKDWPVVVIVALGLVVVGLLALSGMSAEHRRTLLGRSAR